VQRRYEKRPNGPTHDPRSLARETVPAVVRLCQRFGFIGGESGLPQAHTCFTWLRAQKEILDALAKAKTPATRKVNTPQEVREVEAVLAQMSLQQLAQLRLGWLMHSALNF
jgi:hypothetical protein